MDNHFSRYLKLLDQLTDAEWLKIQTYVLLLLQQCSTNTSVERLHGAILDTFTLEELRTLHDHLTHVIQTYDDSPQKSQPASKISLSVSTEAIVKIGLIADMHGDNDGFQQALAIFDREGVTQILCAGDIVDRGPEADSIVQTILERGIACISGNHDQTVLANQAKWRVANKPERLKELGRIISDETVAFLQQLPENAHFTIAGKHILMGHGTPWSDVLGIFPESRAGLYKQLVDRYGADTDILILGHTHQPMQARTGNLWIFNPGSIYGVTIRDSHTCAILALPEMNFTVYDVQTGNILPVPITER